MARRSTEVAGHGDDSGTAGVWRWLAPSLGYALGVGLMGITTKLALRDISWQEMFLWVAAGYTVAAVTLIGVFGVRLGLTRADGFAAASGLFASTGLVFLFLALQHADAGKVVPITAAYPVLTAAVAAVALKEKITPVRLLGTLLVVIGIAMIGLE